MKPITLTFTLCIFIQSTFCFAQKAGNTDFADLVQRPLIVIIETEKGEVIDHLKKDQEKIPVYQQMYTMFNDSIKSLIDRYWKYDTEVEYKTLDDVVDMKKKEKDDTHSVLCIKSKISTSSGSIVEAIGIDWTFLFPESWQNASGRGATTVALTLNRIEDLGKKSDVSISLPSIYYPSVSELVFGLQAMDWCVDNGFEDILSSEVSEFANKNASQLKELNLLISKANVNDKLNDTGKSSSYKYAHEIISSDKFENAILTAEEGSAYIMFCQLMGGNGAYYLPVIINTTTGEILAIVPIDLAMMIKQKSILFSNKMGEKEMAKLEEIVDGK